MDILHFVYRLSGHGYFGLFLTIVNDATMNICLHVSLFSTLLRHP